MLILDKCPYYRQSESIATGRGLGNCDLAGSQAICEGDINFCERPDQLRRQLLDGEKRENGEERTDGKAAAPFSYRVLVVDDQEPMRKLIVDLLSRQGHQCVAAGNGVEALNKTTQREFDAVITDIVMPEMDGIALTKELLSMYPKLPILVVSAHGKEYSADSALVAGARDFIGKPFTIDEFILRFNKMMRERAVLSRMEAKQNAAMVLRLEKGSQHLNPESGVDLNLSPVSRTEYLQKRTHSR